MAMGTKTRDKAGQKLPTRYFSNKQEKQVAEALNGRQTPNSGATAWIKGDVLAEDWLLECKTKMTASESISIKKDWIQKNREEMVFLGKKYQAIVFNFGPDDENHYIIDEFLFKELQEYLANKKEV